MAEKNYIPRLKKLYREKLRQQMTTAFGYANPMEIPRLEKIVVNMGVGSAASDSKKLALPVMIWQQLRVRNHK